MGSEMCIRDRTITVVDTTSPVLIAPESIIQEAINHEANPVRIGTVSNTHLTLPTILLV